MPKREAKGLHPRNVHNLRYDFEELIACEPGLSSYVSENRYGDLSIDFSDAAAVLMLNRALLGYFYGVKEWSIPEGYLCPPVPGRVDYLHYMADLLAEVNGGSIPEGPMVRALDIGTGANCIYPLAGNSLYGWRFVGSDIDTVSLASAGRIIAKNALLHERISLREQKRPDHIFVGLITKKEQFDFTLCNPPFHRSPEEAAAGTQRKNRNLHKERAQKSRLNFGGQANELWCPGGEVAFITKMIKESLLHAKKVLLFSTLVSKKESLPAIYKALKGVDPAMTKTIEMQQGQKVTRIVVWSFKTKAEQASWAHSRWSV